MKKATFLDRLDLSVYIYIIAPIRYEMELIRLGSRFREELPEIMYIRATGGRQ